MPPPPPELARPTSEPAVKVVEMIMPSERTPDREALVQLVRVLASREKTSFRLSAPEPNEPPRRQADLIRKAAERGASVLIVDPARDAEVRKALDEVRSKGVPSVLLAPLDPESGKPFPVVGAAPYADSAGKLVDAALEDAKAAETPAERTAVVLTIRQPDADAQNCAAALEAALKKADVPHSEPLTYDGSVQGAKTALSERLESDPKLSIVLVGEENGLFGVWEVRDTLQGKRPIIVAGYVPANPLMNEVTYSQSAALAIRDLPRIARELFQAALRLASGDAVPDRTAVPDDVRRYASKYIKTPTPPPDPAKPMPE
jgi:ABC-type sugar transport system substrate-binding protein